MSTPVIRPIIDLSCTEEEWLESVSETDRQTRRVVLPAGWCEIPIPPENPAYGARAYVKDDGRTVIFSVGRHDDGKRWLHVSLVLQDGLPSYEDLCEVKRIFVGRKRQAIQVFPPAYKHVNIHERCLHLWCCLDGDGLPDFGREGSI